MKFFRSATGPRFCLALPPLLLLLSCGAAAPRANLSGDAATPLQIQLNNWVRRDKPQIYVRPSHSPGKPPTALFVPLRVTQEMRDPVSVGRNLSRTVWQAWLGLRTFSVLEYARDSQPYDPARALELGRRKGADMVVGGYITQYLDGGHTGSTALSVSIEILECATGDVMWSLAQGGLLEYQSYHDFYLFSLRTRQPVDPPALILHTLAVEMGKPVAAWANNSQGEKGLLDELITPRAF
jgi:hypothetical protein